ncbi:hypothetical protein WMY93_004342 [Mugilogobius chulae]|uniref:MHC class I-like antigen recognition-like domain-containing protein n=1 Tax=Mugilogobius chulae TaxID=88201 RepID=A0AAW0PYZ5_9GOBI
MSVVNIVVFVSLLGAVLNINDAASMTHSLYYFTTSSNDVTNFPEYIEVGYVDGLQISHYDSNTKREVPKQKWMEKITEEDPQYWDTQTHQYGFDGEDFIAFDLKTETFVAPRSEAVPTKHKWERIGEAARQKTTSPTALPLVSFLQKSPSVPGHLPRHRLLPRQSHAVLDKDGDELQEGVDPGELLPNHDGTFQMSVDLDVSSVPPEDWGRYECMFQLSGVEDMPHRLHQDKIRTNAKKHTGIIVGVAVAVLGLVLFAVIAFVVYRRHKANQLTPRK